MRRLRWFALLWLASAVLVGCATKKKEEAPAAPEDGAMAESATPAANEQLEERAAEVERERSEREFTAQKLIDLGDEARARGEWADARLNYARALEVDPGNEAAKSKLADANAMLGDVAGGAKSAFESAANERLVRRQQAQAEITDLVTVGKRLESQGDYEGAVRRYEKALLIVGLYPYYGDFSPTEAQLRDMIAGATARKVEAEKQRKAAAQAQARELAEAQERQQAQAREARIQSLFNQANLAMQRNEFDLAREYAERILELDPTNATAAKLAHLAKQASLAREEEITQRNIREQWKTAFEQVEAAADPQVNPVEFPKTWTKVEGVRKPYAFSKSLSETADPRDRQVMNVLETTTVNINFTDTRLQDAVSFLQNYANVNIMILPSVFQEHSEDELLVNLQAEGVTVKNALDLITLTKGLSYKIDRGVVQIGTEAESRGPVILDLYDVKDLTVPVRSFPGEDINLTPSGGFGFAFFEQEEIEPIKIFEGDALGDLIRETIDPVVWDEGGDVQYREGGILIVKAPKETHAKIRDLLDGLRATGGITVSLETRFITVEDNFLQDIGVDVRSLGDNSGGVGIGGKGSTEPFDDVLAGNVNAPAGIGSGAQSGVFYNIAHHGDIRGRAENLLDVALGRSGLLTNSGGAAIQATYLDDAQAEMILRAVEKSTRSTVVVAPKITVYNHERANVTVLNQVSYIQDFDVEIAQAAQIGDPIVQTLRDGVILDVTPIVSADRKYVTLELRPTVALLQRPIRTFPTTLGNGPPVIIQLPELQIQRVRTTVTMPDGGILLLGGLKFFEEERQTSSVPFIDKIPILNFFWSRRGTFVARKNLIILIKARILVLEEMEPRVTGQ